MIYLLGFLVLVNFWTVYDSKVRWIRVFAAFAAAVCGMAIGTELCN